MKREGEGVKSSHVEFDIMTTLIVVRFHSLHAPYLAMLSILETPGISVAEFLPNLLKGYQYIFLPVYTVIKIKNVTYFLGIALVFFVQRAELITRYVNRVSRHP
ncbi:uncharacterized protein LOC143154711 [Ptiloglossa arizonensis]|uniref:uncharacterized protein LOC143154711 n=1 Tax=Ptiloglossa arizonensis TaxID=3350558 RepID=UPI003F9F7CCC